MKRSASGLLLVVVMVFGILWNGWSLAILVVLIQALGLLEFYRISEAIGYHPLRAVGMAAGLALTVFLFLSLHFALPGAWILWIPGLVLLMLGFYRNRVYQHSFVVDLGLTSMGWLYLTMPMALVLLLSYKTGSHEGLLVLFLISLVWANDTMAYVAGKTAGRHTLAPGVSPGKTWEGTFGGLLASAGGAAIWVQLDGINLMTGQAVISGLLIGAGAVVGDLFQSALKRSAGWEDSGQLIPGHGGVLDRFDGLLVSVPLCFPVLYLW